jgi:hypothetical protein
MQCSSHRKLGEKRDDNIHGVICVLTMIKEIFTARKYDSVVLSIDTPEKFIK